MNLYLITLLLNTLLVHVRSSPTDGPSLNDSLDSYIAAKSRADEKIRSKINTLTNSYIAMKTKPAKNVIVFIGDGMGGTILTASRIYRSQKNSSYDYQQPFEFETFPYSGLSQTFSADSHVSDSASGAVAIHCGVKTNNDLVSIDDQVTVGQEEYDKSADLKCLAELALLAGKAVGIVTTTRLTHATPATLYAHSTNRKWESDADMLKFGTSSKNKDIARQLVEDFPGTNFTVILGGGSKKFKPNCTTDKHSERQDGKHLINDWLKLDNGKRRRLVTSARELESVDVEATEQLLGVFANDHLKYEGDNNESYSGEPTLAQMSTVALKILQKNENGYFMFVEGGKIDMALHENRAKLGFEEVIAFDDAIRSTLQMVSLHETLVVVTADHSHNLNILGFPAKSTSILGLVYGNDTRIPFEDNMPSTILTFADGPGANNTASRRESLWTTDTEANGFRQLSLIPRVKASHGGEDVPVYATGVYSYLFTGLMDNTEIAHYIMSASCLGADKTICTEVTGGDNAKALTLKDLSFSNAVGTILVFLLSVALFVSLFINVILACRNRYY